MSVARVYTSPKHVARKGKVLTCGKCGDIIEKGSPYRWYKKGFRSNYKYIRCMKSSCSPKPSELESSLLSEVYSSQEDANDALDALDAGDPEQDASSINAAVQAAAEGFTSVAEQYREAAEAMGDAGSEMEEKANTLEDSAGELEGFEVSESEPDIDHDSHGDEEDRPAEDDCEECREERQEWWSNMVQEGRDAIDEAELP